MKNLVTYAREWVRANWLGVAIVLLVGFAAGAAFAGSATATWIHPTQNVGGSALPLSQITGTRIEWGSCSGANFGTKAGEVLVPAPATSKVISNLAPGSYCFRAYTQANGGESAPSAVVPSSIAFPLPGSPTLTVVAAVAYDVRWSWKDRAFVLNRKVGTVPIGAACLSDFALAGGYARVEMRAVKFTRRSSSPVIVAQCA